MRSLSVPLLSLSPPPSYVTLILCLLYTYNHNHNHILIETSGIPFFVFSVYIIYSQSQPHLADSFKQTISIPLQQLWAWQRSVRFVRYPSKPQPKSNLNFITDGKNSQFLHISLLYTSWNNQNSHSFPWSQNILQMLDTWTGSYWFARLPGIPIFRSREPSRTMRP